MDYASIKVKGRVMGWYQIGMKHFQNHHKVEQNETHYQLLIKVILKCFLNTYD